MAALVLLAVAGLIGWRVLAPAEVLSPAATPYPSASVSTAQVTGRTNMAPLIVDESLRVYAAKRQVRADGPVDAKSVNTARWSLRRWPAEVSGVVASGSTVISRWSDGRLIAVDGRTGKELWTVATGPDAPGYDGHRTGASVVWAPVDLWVGGEFVLVREGQRLSAYGVSSGARGWSVEVPAACTDGFTTTSGQYVCASGAYAISTGAAVTSYGNQPLTCAVGRSMCAGSVPGDTPPGTQLLGVSRGRLVVLTAERHLQVIRGGAVVADFPLAVGSEKLDWKPGRWQVTDDWVAIERLTADGPADPEAPEHYLTVDTVIIASLR
ncbi:PQQ-binding-like beta-propeller repeat protein [Actinoplanes sp. LDG1-06]|uniref:PQQ-binding-like beta-propeller repeat protein n=1 Tax=Paractinoplanes ovalisporus TaxID=2810368 RepID=A0ABS2ABP8_9ACTN|nr:PQQ-binding-like beta-propeller repeat protein [Actinoplanes ovalisporus]